MIKGSENETAAKAFVEFLRTDEAMKIFKTYGFSAKK
ncbi:MAG TPA: substrate-binding domain-containing protein [Clostridiaceae bacterium]